MGTVLIVIAIVLVLIVLAKVLGWDLIEGIVYLISAICDIIGDSE